MFAIADGVVRIAGPYHAYSQPLVQVHIIVQMNCPLPPSVYNKGGSTIYFSWRLINVDIAEEPHNRFPSTGLKFI